MVELKQLSTGSYVPDWCPGCGDFAILNAVKGAIVKLNLDPKDVLVVSGIGCSSKLPQWINTFGFHSLHGRGLPFAMGARIANKDLHILVIGGDGDVYGEGVNHFIHALRKNINVTLLVHDNQIYGLTKGQASPTTMKDDKTSSTPDGVVDDPFNPMTIAVAQDTSYIAQAFAGDLPHLTDMIAQAISFKGFSFLNIFQPCVTFNKHNTYAWFKERCYDLQKTRYKTDNLHSAFKKAQELGDKIPVGLFYKKQKPLFEDMHPNLKDKPLFKQPYKNVDIKPLLERLC